MSKILYAIGDRVRCLSKLEKDMLEWEAVRAFLHNGAWHYDLKRNGGMRLRVSAAKMTLVARAKTPAPSVDREWQG